MNFPWLKKKPAPLNDSNLLEIQSLKTRVETLETQIQSLNQKIEVLQIGEEITINPVYDYSMKESVF